MLATHVPVRKISSANGQGSDGLILCLLERLINQLTCGRTLLHVSHAFQLWPCCGPARFQVFGKAFERRAMAHSWKNVTSFSDKRVKTADCTRRWTEMVF